VSDHVPPFPAGALFADRHRHQPEIAGLPVGADDEAILQVLDFVFMVVLTRKEHLERQVRIVRVGVAPFGGEGSFHVDEKKLVGFGLGNAGVQRQIGLFENHGIPGRVGAHGVLLDPQPEQGFRILLDIEERPVVVGPGDVGSTSRIAPVRTSPVLKFLKRKLY